MTESAQQDPESELAPTRATTSTAGHVRDSPSTFAVLGAVTSQVALITGLLYYFGWTYSRAYYRYFGVDVRMLGYSTSDYLLSSIAVTYWPAVLSLLPLLVVIGAHRLVALPALAARQRDAGVEEGQPNASSWIQWALTIMLDVGVGLVVYAVLAITFSAHLGIYLPIMLLAGVILVAYALFLRTNLNAPMAMPTPAQAPTARTSWVLPLALLALGFLAAFWAVGLYGDDQGRRDADAKAHNLGELTTIVVFSVNELSIIGGNSQRDTAPGADAHFRYRYTGLVLLANSADKYYLLPSNWQRCRDLVFVVRDAENIRVDMMVNPITPPEKSTPHPREQSSAADATDPCHPPPG